MATGGIGAVAAANVFLYHAPELVLVLILVIIVLAIWALVSITRSS